MPAETHRKRQLTQLHREIEDAEAESARLNSERGTIISAVAQARRRLRYLLIARTIRRPAQSFESWPVVVMIVAPGLFGVLLFVMTHVVFGSLLIALLAFVLAAAGGAAVVAALFYRPPDAMLESAIAEAEANCRLENARLAEKNQRLLEMNRRLQRLVEERRDQVASGKLQRAALLQRNWKKMHEAEWEDFVVEVCRTLGAAVERTGRSDAQDANLIVKFSDRRVAVLTRGEGTSVSSATIQQALAAKDRQRCDSCAVVINRRFTGAAQDFARRHGCTSIGTGEFPDFVLGKIEL